MTAPSKFGHVTNAESPDLALIFQPGVLTHAQHELRPREHVVSQQVLEFLIEHQDNFLIGMQLKPKRRKPKKTNKVKPPSPPPRIKADPDLMLPSDSDDDVPEDGYYIVETAPRLVPASDPPPVITSPRVEPSLLPVAKSGRPNHRTIAEGMELSDSDDDAPPGGYEVRQGRFEAAKSKAEGL